MQLYKLFHVGLFTTLLANPNFHRSYFASVLYRTVTLRPNQSICNQICQLAFSLLNKSNLAVFQTRLAVKIIVLILISEKHLATMFVTSSKFQK